METYCREDACAILHEFGTIGIANVVNEIADKYTLSDRFLLQQGHLLDIYALSAKVSMSIAVYMCYKSRLNWDGVSRLIELTPNGIQFIMDNIENINITIVIERMVKESIVDISALRRLIAQATLDGTMTQNMWNKISYCESLPAEFIRTYVDYLDWYILSMCSVIPEDLMVTYSDKLNWTAIWSNRQVTETTIEALLNGDCTHSVTCFWPIISVSQDLSESFIDAHRDDLTWTAISEYQNMSYDFMLAHESLIDLEFLLKNRKSKWDDIHNFINYKNSQN